MRHEFAAVDYESGLFSDKRSSRSDSVREQTALASQIGGKSIVLSAGRDMLIRGSNVVSDEGTSLVAGGNIDILTQEQASSESHSASSRQSGLFGGGSSLTLGSRSRSDADSFASVSHAASTIGALRGNINIIAGGKATIQGSNLVAAEGDVNALAKSIEVLDAQGRALSDSVSKERQSGLSIGLTSPLLSATQTVNGMAQAASRSSNARMQALAVASSALAIYDTAQALQASGGDLTQGLGLSVSLGTSRSESHSSTTQLSSQGSTIRAGGSVNLIATGAGLDSNIIVRGSQIGAAQDVNLVADNRVLLLAGLNSLREQASNSSSSASIGLNFGIGASGLSFGAVSASASEGKGASQGSSKSWSNTQVLAGGTFNVQAGGDMVLQGAVVQAERIAGHVKGNLLIESLQDSSNYRSRQDSASAGFSIGPSSFSANASANRSRVNGNFTSVGQQSGLRAGDGGFQLLVDGAVDLRGGAITSTQRALDEGKNSFSYASISLSDIQNTAAYDASSAGASIGFGSAGSSAGAGNDRGHASSVTTSGVSGLIGDQGKRTGDKEQGIAPIFDANKVQQEVNAQVQITQTFGPVAARAVADFAQGQVNALREQAKNEADPQKRAALLQQQQAWEEGGAYRVALHTATGALSGGVQGALAGQSHQISVICIREWRKTVNEQR